MNLARILEDFKGELLAEVKKLIAEALAEFSGETHPAIDAMPADPPVA